MVRATTTVPSPIGPPRTTPTISQLSSKPIRIRGSGRPVRSDAADASSSPEPAPRPDTISDPAPTPSTNTAATWIARTTTNASGGSTRSSTASIACILGPTMSGETSVPGPGRRPINHAAAINDAITSHTDSVNDNPVRTRTAPMKTSSGPGPSPLHNMTATPPAMINEPATRRPTRAEPRSSRGVGPLPSTAAMAPGRLNARRCERHVGVAVSDASVRG